MKIKQAQFILSQSTYLRSSIEGDMPQIAVVGKSNVGKSSFINFLCNNGKLARTSKQPGRTRLINYFLCNSCFHLVDLPGYGYAEVSKQEKEKWADLIGNYLAKEDRLCHIFFLLDVRHTPTDNDGVMYNYIVKSNIPFTVIATKEDKVSKTELAKNKRNLSAYLKVGSGDVFTVSSTAKTGLDAVYERLQLILDGNHLQEDDI